MRKSSAYKIPYDIRPSKQTERRILLDLLRTAMEAGFDLNHSKYIGFGGYKFYDFEMLYRHLGIRRMTSLELDRSLFARCKFNMPFGFIEFQEGYLRDYLERTLFTRPIIAWLDYDCRLDNSVLNDVRTFCARLPPGSFIFVTVDARVPEGMKEYTLQERLAAIREEYGRLALVSDPDELSNDRFPLFAERVIWAVMSESLSRRSEGVFVPMIRVLYKDSAEMATAGACLAPRELAEGFRKRLRAGFRFLLPNINQQPFLIPPFNLTPRERRLFDQAVTRKSTRATLGSTLRRLGFTRREIDDYRKLHRFIPTYVESYI